MMLGFYPVAMALGMSLTGPLPTYTFAAASVLFFVVMEDMYQYFVHRAMHWGPFYKHVHKWHHLYTAPFGLCAEYAHPLETLVLGLGFFRKLKTHIVGPLIWASLADMHVLTILLWTAVRLVQTVDAHSGYDFPWGLRHFVPFWAGAEFHDYHHLAFKGNYASFFRVWDIMFGTVSPGMRKKSKAM